jgi:hypothetical protein
MGILVGENVIAPVDIGLKFLRASIDWTPAPLVPQEDVSEPVGDLVRYLEWISAPARSVLAITLFDQCPCKD